MAEGSYALPARYLEPWEDVATEAKRRRLSVFVRIREGTELVDGDDGILRGSFDLFVTGRSGIEEKIGHAATFDQALATLREKVATFPLPGPDALREELRAFGRRLAVLTPRDVAKKSGADVPIYRIYRDRILPLAWDNLVESVRVEALEDFVRRVGDLDVGALTKTKERTDAIGKVADLAAEARGLVAPKASDASG